MMISRVKDVAGLAFQPPFEILSAPPGFVVQPAFRDLDVFVCSVQNYHHMMISPVSVLNEITGPDLTPARSFYPPPGEITAMAGRLFPLPILSVR